MSVSYSVPGTTRKASPIPSGVLYQTFSFFIHVKPGTLGTEMTSGSGLTTSYKKDK